MRVSASEIPLTDDELITRFRSGERESFDELVRRHQQRVYWIARRIVGNHDDADDVVQDVFIKVYRTLRSFRGESSFATWVYRIAVNTAISLQRKKQIRSMIGLPESFWSERSGHPPQRWRASDVPPSDYGFEADERRALIERAIARLPKKQRLVFVLRYYEELSYAEISKILKTSVGGLKANYYHAFRKVAAFVKQRVGTLPPAK